MQRVFRDDFVLRLFQSDCQILRDLILPLERRGCRGEVAGARSGGARFFDEKREEKRKRVGLGGGDYGPYCRLWSLDECTGLVYSQQMGLMVCGL